MSAPVIVTLDYVTMYPAHDVAPERWNGWACPYFTRETVERIARDFAAVADEYTPVISFDGDTVVVLDPQYPDDAERLEPCADGTYPLGAWAWVWSIVEHAEYPHHAGMLYDCPACNAACHCEAGSTECVFDGAHSGSAS